MNGKLPNSPGGPTAAPKRSHMDTRGDIDAFLNTVNSMPTVTAGGGGRLVFALDATASREGTWRQAQTLHAEMFQAAADLGGLEVQLVYYRGLGECRTAGWTSQPDRLLSLLGKVDCIGGETQIAKVLRHALGEGAKTRVNALVFVGDAMEEEVDRLCALAGEMGVKGIPAFIFHEGEDAVAARAFVQIAKLSGGACCRFDSASAGQLRALLRAVAVFAAGGRKALLDHGRREGGAVLQITRQMGG